MYRQPIDPGYSSIGAAIALGLGNAAEGLRRGRGEDEDKRRFELEQARLRRAEELRAEEIRHQREREALDDQLRGIGTRDPARQADPIVAAVNTIPAGAGMVPPGALRGPVPVPQGGDPILTAVAQARQPAPRTEVPAPLAEGELDLGGGRVFRPTRSADYATRRAETAVTRQEEARLRAEAAARLRAANPHLSPQEAEVMASGIKLEDLMTPKEQEDRAARMLLRELQIRQPFELAQRAASRARSGGGERTGDTTRLTMPQQREAAEAEIENILTDWAPGFLSGEGPPGTPITPEFTASLRARYPKVPPAQLDRAVRAAWDKAVGGYFDDTGLPKSGNSDVTYDPVRRAVIRPPRRRAVAPARSAAPAARREDAGLAQARRDYDELVAQHGAAAVRQRLGPRP